MNNVYLIGLSCALIAQTASNTFAGESAQPGIDLAKLRASIEREVLASVDEGYVPYITQNLLKSAEGLPQDRVRSVVLRAKGALLDLKFPVWAREPRYYRQQEVARADPDRRVVFLDTDWATEGSWPGQWFRAHCRPRPGLELAIEDMHRKGLRVGPYMSGGLVPITYALIPENEDDWDSFFMRKYAGVYWHGSERWWGATGDRPGWAAWMLSHLDYAAQVGFDFIHLDEAWGVYPEARPMNESRPGFLVVPNNFSKTYVDADAFRFGWAAMGEAAGTPTEWDEFRQNVRRRCQNTNGVTIWNWLTVSDKGFYGDLAFATTLANKTTNVSESNPSREFVLFSRQFSDYLYGPSVDIDVNQEAAKIVKGLPSARTALTRRTFISGRQELILHLFNTDEKLSTTGPMEAELNVAGLNLTENPVLTFITPGGVSQQLEMSRESDTIRFTVPGVKVWGMVIVGRPVFPQSHLRLVSRQGAAPTYPLDNFVVPGEAFEVDARFSAPLSQGHSLRLQLPKNWLARQVGNESHVQRYVITPAPDSPQNRGYAITPIVNDGHETIPSWPFQVETKDPLTVRILPSGIDAPARSPTKVQLEVKSNGAGGTAKLALKVPQGWKIGQRTFQIEVKAGQAERVSTTLWAPDMGVRFWHHKDVQVGVDWELAGTKGKTQTRIRVFPAQFSVYHRGLEKRIMHGYPNALFRGEDMEAAKKALVGGDYVVLWLVNQDPDAYAPLVDWFLAHGGGVVWMGKPFSGKNCPAELVRDGVRPSGLNLAAGRNSPLVAPLCQVLGGTITVAELPFNGCWVRAADWASVIATWVSGGRQSPNDSQEFPAIVISTDRNRRIVYMASDLATTSETNYGFEERWHGQNCWHLTYLYYNLLAWAAGVQSP